MYRISRESLVLLALISILWPSPSLSAQHVPGSSSRPSRETREARYRGEVLRAVQPQISKWLESWGSGDSDDFADLYTEDARLLFGETMVLGRDAIEKYFEGVRESVTGITMTLVDFYVSDQLAFAMGRYSYQILENGRHVEQVADVFVATFIRQGNDWHIRSHLFRDPLPLRLEPVG